jgi:hypothetical protein
VLGLVVVCDAYVTLFLKDGGLFMETLICCYISLQYEGAVVFAKNEGFYDVIVALLDDAEMRLGIQLNALMFARE